MKKNCWLRFKFHKWVITGLISTSVIRVECSECGLVKYLE